MTIKSNFPKAASLKALDELAVNNDSTLEGIRGRMETKEVLEPQIKRNSTRKRKSDETVDVGLEQFVSCSEFTNWNHNENPVIVNCRDAFFDKNSRSFQTTEAVETRLNDERIIKPAKSLFDDDDRTPCEVSNRSSPHNSPTTSRREFHKKPLYNNIGGGSPCGVVDELLFGFYGCMPSWECSMPWRDNDDTDDEDEEKDQYGIVRRDMTRHDANNMREHLSFPKHLGKEYVSRPEENRRERNTASINRTIRRSPSSRLTTLESDSRHKLPGSKMFRRTDINEVTEIHWDEEVLDTDTLEQMAKLSVY